MKNTIKFVVYIVLILSGIFQGARAQSDTLAPASLTPAVVPEFRYPDDDRINEFKQDEDFNYLNQAAPGQSLWDRFWAFINRLFSYLFVGTSSGYLNLFIRLFIYGIALFAIGYSLYKLLYLRFVKTTTAAEEEGLGLQITEENIHALNFDDLLQEALENHNWRLAIRIRYLQTLKFLSDSEFIAWEPYKTNHEYSYEIEQIGLRQQFERISYYFDYAWYGEFDVNKEHYDRVGDILNEMKGKE